MIWVISITFVNVLEKDPIIVGSMIAQLLTGFHTSNVFDLGCMDMWWELQAPVPSSSSACFLSVLIKKVRWHFLPLHAPVRSFRLFLVQYLSETHRQLIITYHIHSGKIENHQLQQLNTGKFRQRWSGVKYMNMKEHRSSLNWGSDGVPVCSKTIRSSPDKTKTQVSMWGNAPTTTNVVLLCIL